jgi:hypothetical protein
MPAKDIYHDVVCHAIIKDDWVITDDPYTLKLGTISNLFIDLGIEKVIAATKENKKIAVEIKSFVSNSLIADLEKALGQYILYSKALKLQEPERILYLALPESAFDNLFQDLTMRTLFLEDSSLNLLVFNPEREVITKWIP